MDYSLTPIGQAEAIVSECTTRVTYVYGPSEDEVVAVSLHLLRRLTNALPKQKVVYFDPSTTAEQNVKYLLNCITTNSLDQVTVVIPNISTENRYVTDWIGRLLACSTIKIFLTDTEGGNISPKISNFVDVFVEVKQPHGVTVITQSYLNVWKKTLFWSFSGIDLSTID